MRRWWVGPLVPVYWAGLAVKNALFRVGVLRARRLTWPVVSVGSLSAGGAGKTPVVLMLAELLAAHGVEVDVLSRGYGRGSGVVEEVDAAGEAGRFGDEPLEMARRGVRVWVGADRWVAGRESEQQQGINAEDAKEGPRRTQGKAGVHVLDDGFQHRRLHRDLDVVLLTAEDVRDWLLPGGNLREPLGALGRADVVVVREEEAGELAGVIAARTGADVWVVRRELVVAAGGARRPLVFCGIARPDGFLGMVRAAGVEVAGEIRFGDHHAYGEDDFEQLAAAGRRAGADGFLTTAKDAVKISASGRKRLEEVGPVAVGELRVSLVDEAGAWGRMALVLGRTAFYRE